MQYSVWLLGLSICFLVVERFFPRRPQPFFSRRFATDLGYLLLNGEYLGVALGAIAVRGISVFDAALEAAGIHALAYAAVANSWPLALQFVVLLLVFDFVQYGVHFAMHRIPVLWRFHKIHHSSEELNWISNWRFHFMETLCYRATLYPLAAFFGFSVEAMFAYGVVNTVAGHFTHSNLSATLGPLRFLLNGPHMHSWHHVHPEAGPVDRNFGIALSLWDHLFGTAYLPERKWPTRLGFEGVEHYPT